MIHILYETIQLVLIAGTAYQSWVLTKFSKRRVLTPSKKDVDEYIDKQAKYYALKWSRVEAEKVRNDLNSRVNNTLTALVKRVVALEE